MSHPANVHFFESLTEEEKYDNLAEFDRDCDMTEKEAKEMGVEL